MTPAELRTALTATLAAHLGTFTRPNGSTTPAIWVGEPPSDWIATGVEVRIEPGPEYDNRPVHHGTAILREYTVRVIPHGGSGQAVVERIVQAYETSNPTTIPALPSVGINQQYALRIRS